MGKLSRDDLDAVAEEYRVMAACARSREGREGWLKLAREIESYADKREAGRDARGG